jgi:hypothetical protein
MKTGMIPLKKVLFLRMMGLNAVKFLKMSGTKKACITHEEREKRVTYFVCKPQGRTLNEDLGVGTIRMHLKAMEYDFID